MGLKSFVINDKAVIIDALIKINDNKKGFLLVNNSEGKVIGTLTDGDIRRAFIDGATTQDRVLAYCKENFKYLKKEEGLLEAINFFKSESIKFLPILNEEKKLVNIITKSQLHSLLLQDIHADLMYDFQTLDDNITNHEIFQRPWGFYKTTVMNNYCQSKIICVYPDSKLSLQSHDYREEHWIVAHGRGIVQIGESFLDARCGNSFFIPKGCKHRLTNIDHKENLVITEVQIGNYFGEDDIHRYEDIYGRM